MTSGGLGGPEAMLESFDKARGAFTFRGPGGPRQVAAGDVPMIDFPVVEAAGDDPPSAAVMAAFHNGTRLSGRVVEITGDAIRLDCPALVDPLVCEFRQLAEIEALVRQRPGPLPGRLGRLTADTGLRIAGNVIWDGGPDHPLGLGEESCGAGSSCSPATVQAANEINTRRPEGEESADGRLRVTGWAAQRAVPTPPPPSAGARVAPEPRLWTRWP